MSDISITLSTEDGESRHISSTSLPGTRSSTPAADDAASFVDQAALRKQIHSIQEDASLSPSEKARRMQELMTSRSPLTRRSISVTSLDTSCASEAPVADKQDCRPTYSKDGSSLGCEHYRRGCRKLADCCKRWYTCRFCHDNAEDHEINRFATKYMLCMRCFKAQRAAQSCKECKAGLASYYCDLCKLWDDDASKQIYHCDGCGLCRRGPKDSYTHCTACRACMTNEHFASHKCIERSLECDCPICGEYLFTSTRSVMFMQRCGHPMHSECFEEHRRLGNYQCPMCFKSICDTSALFTQIDMMLESERMPDEYARLQSFIFCNDCEERSWTKFHFIYHKCSSCASYNTKLLKTAEDEDSSSSDGVSAMPRSDPSSAEDGPVDNTHQ